MLRFTAPLLAACLALPLSAQTLSEVATWPHGDWRVAVLENPEADRQLCAAETLSVFGQVLRVVLYEDGDAFVEIRDVTWDYVNGDPLRFHLIVGSNERIVTGQGWDGSMSLDLVETGTRAALLDRLSKGERLDVRMPNRSRVAQFSLDGAEAAIAAAETCWAAIQAGETYVP